MRTRGSIALVLLASGLATSMHIAAQQLPAQQQTLPQQTPTVAVSTVTGRVICSDTNAPARFGKVLLKSTVPNHTGEDFMKNMEQIMQKAAAKDGGTTPPKPMSDQQKRAMATAEHGMNRATDMLNSSTIGLDGSYSFSGVKPGTYYVHAIYAGYIDPYSQFSDEDFASTDPATRARVAQLPTITVKGGDPAHVDLRLERGAAISGRLVYDDGTPAVGWVLSAIKPNTVDKDSDTTSAVMAQALAMSGAVQMFKSDDRGQYRITGLAAGDYDVRATLVATDPGISATNLGQGGSGINLAVYNGDTFSRAKAKPVSISAGKEHTGVDIIVPTHLLHNIIGHVYAKSDGHAINMGSVTLTSKNDPGLYLKASIREDGSFNFEYLPAGETYTVTVADAADAKSTGCQCNILGISIPNQEILRKYGSDTSDVALTNGDVDSVKLTVAQTDWTPPAKKPGDAVTPADLLKGLLGGDAGDKPKQ